MTKAETQLSDREFKIMRWKMLREVQKHTPPEQHRDLAPGAGMWLLAPHNAAEGWLQELRADSLGTHETNDATPTQPPEPPVEQPAKMPIWLEKLALQLDGVRYEQVRRLYEFSVRGLSDYVGLPDAQAKHIAHILVELYLREERPPSIDCCQLGLTIAFTYGRKVAEHDRVAVVVQIFRKALERLPPSKHQYGSPL